MDSISIGYEICIMDSISIGYEICIMNSNSMGYGICIMYSISIWYGVLLDSMIIIAIWLLSRLLHWMLTNNVCVCVFCHGGAI